MDSDLRDLERRLRAAPGDTELRKSYRRALQRAARPVPTWLGARITPPIESFASKRIFEVMFSPVGTWGGQAIVRAGLTPGTVELPPHHTWGVAMPDLRDEKEVVVFLEAVHEERIPGLVLRWKDETTKLAVKNLHRVPDLAWLFLSYDAERPAEEDLAPVGRLRHLRGLEFWSRDSIEGAFLRSGELEDLSHVALRIPDPTRTVLDALRTLPALVSVEMAGFRLESVNGFAGADNLGSATGHLETVLRFIEAFPRLEAVAIEDLDETIRNHELPERFAGAVKHLKDLPELASLSVHAGLPLREDHLVRLVKVVRALTSLRSLDLSWIGIEDRHLRGLASLGKLRTLRLRGEPGGERRRITAEGLRELAGLTGLDELDLGGTLVDDDALLEVAAFGNLRTLRLDGTDVSGRGLEHLRPLRGLRSIDLRNTTIGETAELRPLAVFSELESVRWGPADDDEGFPSPDELVRLTRVKIPGEPLFDGLGPWATDDALEALRRAGRLEGRPLVLVETEVTGKGLLHLEGLSLPGLVLDIDIEIEKELPSIEALAKMRSLPELELRHGTGAALAHVMAIPGLERLTLRSVRISPAELGYVPEILRRGISLLADDCSLACAPDSLEIEDPADVISALNFKGIGGKTLALRNFGRLQPYWMQVISSEGEALERIDLTGCRSLGDVAMESLEGMPELRWLSIAGCSVTDEGLRWLLECPKLEHLDVSDNPGITVRGLEALRRIPTLREVVAERSE